MTIELVDGHGGKPHISGDDLGDFKAGILGDAGYVFKRADMLAATLNGANSLTVNTGSGILPGSGRHFRITAPETVAVTSGTQGQNRNDLVVIRPSTSTDGTTVENASVVVLRGTPTDGDAVDPEKEDTDLALYRLQLTGISVADPIALFDVMVPYNEFRDSISQFYQTEKQTVLINGTSNNLFYFDLDIPAGYMACALRYLSITSPNAACVISSYRLGDSQLNINVRNTSGSQVTAEVEASILCLKLN